ncbi:MAG: hypothetical protein OXU79_00260 [Gemmatimonadota bacterium]|nr:hypothetical protein [Gemmatimonadota bacterium]
MKIIFSRKGSDSSSGGKPSPIFPDGTALSLPIPYLRSPTRFSDVRWHNTSVGSIVECLTNGRVKGRNRCHLDPDLNADALPRLPGWRPAFGQVEKAQSHLENQGVGPGDLFLFFGWFRAVERANGATWRYVPNAPDRHVLFGWLQVFDVVPIVGTLKSARSERSWLSRHPHVNRHWDNNTVYVARETLSIKGLTSRRGAGLFGGTGERLTLTPPRSAKRSEWRLPSWFFPKGRRPLLSYHHERKHWRGREPWVYFKTVGRGQEFVVDVGGIPEANAWLRELFET